MLDAAKTQKLCGLMKEMNLDAVIIGPSQTLAYLTGFTPFGCERFQALVLTKDGDYAYVCNLIYSEDMRRVFPDKTRFYIWHDGQGPDQCLKDLFSDLGLSQKRIALGDTVRAVDLIDMKALFSCQWINGVPLLEELRIIKSESDLDRMRTAARIADGVMEDLAQFVRPGMTEKEVKEKILDLFIEKGAQGPAFPPIVACGSNSSMPHYCEDKGVIAQKDVLLLDLGCRFEGFCSDTSRTFFIGDISKEEKEIYTAARAAQAAAVKAAREGAKCSDVDRAAREIVREKGYGPYFLNRTGHGIGFDVHEAPYMNAMNHRPLERGMAFSVEPGINISGKVGMRVEDIVVINHSGETEVLNRFTKDIVIIS